MSRNLTIDNHTQRQQQLASSPKRSAWVSANAGSGKTYVLAQRVVRLLLSGVDPSRILCLTYTNAAAGEMSNRVFTILGEWVSLSDAKLREQLTSIEGRTASGEELARARILFARALETPGGLKVQTIHAFCEALLHQFPLEANIPGSFKVMDDRMQRQLVLQERRTIAKLAYAEPQSPLGLAFAHLIGTAGDKQIEKVLEEVITNRGILGAWLSRIGGPTGATQNARQLMSFSPTQTVEDLQHAAVNTCQIHVLNCTEIAVFCESLCAKNPNELAAQIRQLQSATENAEKFDIISDLLLVKSGAPRNFERRVTKAVDAMFPDLRDRLAAAADDWVGQLMRIRDLQQIEMTEPLLVVAGHLIDAYANAKRKQGLLDFDDLIDRTVDLLSTSDARAWVLYKLDLGIDHILLDEAQDTSPQQWQIVTSLVDEFFSGQSARNATRTVFAVGDEKQSIYSFRGAEPKSFADQKHNYTRQAAAAQRKFSSVGLALSFRSTPDVLGAVDAVFALPENAQGVTFDGSSPGHTAARDKDPGCVDVWDLISPEAAVEPPNWHTPMDSAGQHQALLLAEKIADQLQKWIGRERLEATGKLITAGDILILVRARDRFVGALNRELKSRQIPVAGADRLVITEHIAVQDLMAVGQVVLTPLDDLTMSALLKSPLLNLGEEEVLELNQRRFVGRSTGDKETSLYDVLQQATEPEFDKIRLEIDRWRELAASGRVYEFYANILGTLGGRKKILARLGTEAEDVLDAFLDAALAHENGDMPGLQSFLTALMEEQPEIKREMDRTAGEVRIMTVHAAKGLEAPIVFLVDKSSPAYQGQHASTLYNWQTAERDNCFLWAPGTDSNGSIVTRLREEERQRAESEYRRLLYVGMTRAEDRLIICGYRGVNKPPSPGWHSMVSAALEPDWEDVLDADGNLLWHRWRSSSLPAASAGPNEADQGAETGHGVALPDWIKNKLPQEKTLPRPLNPSGARALIDKALIRDAVVSSPFAETRESDTDSEPRLRGTALHKLLQTLPYMETSARNAAANSYLERTLPGSTAAERQTMTNAVHAVIEDPDLAACFDPVCSRGEVPLMGRIEGKEGPLAVSGTIDRLAVLDDRVLVLDYKTSPNVPAAENRIPQDHVMQMALYRALIQRLYPEKSIHCLLIWTHASPQPVTMEVPRRVMDAAMEKIAQV